MATKMSQRAVQYRGIEANEMFFNPIFMDMVSVGNFKVLANVSTKKKMQFVSELEKIVQKASGCGFTPSGKLGIYERSVEVDNFKINMEQCYDEFEDLILEEKLKKGNLKYDLNGTEIMNILIEKVRDAAALDYMRLFWFGNKASVDPAYNITDGIWSVHIPALVAANSIPYTNTGSGSALADGDAIDYLKKVYDSAPRALKGLPNNLKKFYVCGTIYEQYRDDLESSGGGDAGRSMMINGVERLTFRGIEIVPNWNWNHYMENDLGSPDSHMILYTTPQNLVFATDLLSDNSAIQIFKDDLEEKTYVKVNGKFGTNYVHESLFSVGY